MIPYSDEIKYAEIIRGMIECENRLLNDRINWLVTIQGLLFTALGFAWDKQDTKGLITIFSFLGMIVALSAWTSLKISNQARQGLVQWWDDKKSPTYQGPDVIGIRTFAKKREKFLRPWYSLPVVFILGWIFVLIFNWARI